MPTAHVPFAPPRAANAQMPVNDPSDPHAFNYGCNRSSSKFEFELFIVQWRFQISFISYTTRKNV